MIMKSPTLLLRPSSWFITLVFLFVMVQCKNRSDRQDLINPAFTEKIVAFTAGVISSESPIQVVLAEDYNGEVTPDMPAGEDLFQFKPAIKGQVVWVDKRTIEFRPAEKLRSGKEYTAKFRLSKILDVPRELSVLEFSFTVVKQALTINIEGYHAHNENDLVWNRIKGTVNTADYIDNEDLKKYFSVTQENRLLDVTMDISPDRRTFSFWIDSVLRTEKPGKVNISWNATDLEPGLKGEQQVDIPALGDFKVMHVTVIQQPEQYIQIMFSDPVKKMQDFEGLIFLGNNTSLSFTITGNLVKAFPVVRMSGENKITVQRGVMNILGYELKEPFATELTFEMPKPAVRLVGKGVILPSSKGLIFPFEAVNLEAVDIKIIRIFENNIGHFLQVNQLDGSNQLKRAGRLVHRQKVILSNSPVDLGRWNMFYLDLATLIQPDPGSIYRVEISFRKSYSRYMCADQQASVENEPDLEEENENYGEEDSYWDSYEEYYDEYYAYDSDYEYNWEERDDPCKPSYYRYGRSVARNILASDLGLIVKTGNNDRIICAVTDLITTQPLSDVEVTLYNYQQQPLATASTDKDGFAVLTTTEKPFLLIAKFQKQRGYLRMDDGSARSLGAFDVSGNQVQKGLKGFIYGERGVWRPGDTLFLNFILEDKQKLLPAAHPVAFELYTPRGQLFARSIKTSGINGFYSWAIATAPESETGSWNLRVKVGGTVFNKNLRIETVKPNRLKIAMEFTTKQLSASQPDITGDLSAAWLHGAVAGNLKAKVHVILTQATTSFEKYGNYQFTDPAKAYSPEEQLLFEGSTGNDGKTKVPARIKVDKSSPGMLNAHFTVRVFEQSGDFSTDRFTMPYSPYSSYIGLKTPEGDKRGMLLTDTTHWTDVVTLDENGKPVSRQGVTASLYKLDWRNWWESTGDDLADFIGNTYNRPVMSKNLSTVNGKGRFSFRIDRPMWGRFYLRITDPVSGHSAGRILYIDWPGWAGRPMRDNPEAASMLTFNSGKEKYAVGETAEVVIPTGGAGRALLCIESGSQVLHNEWLPVTEKETRYRFTVTPEMTPNVYVHVTLVQPHANTLNDMPLRMYGVIPVFVEDPQTRLAPVIKMPDVLEPLQKFTIQVSEQNKREMTYTLAVVEDGLLDLTRFKTPDPWNEFYAREALGVKTWDMYDMVIGAYGGNLGNVLGIGGDAEALNPGASEKANRFKPVVRYMGPFTLSRGKNNSHAVEIPNYIGSVRVMVVAGQNGSYGNKEKTVPVKKPLMILATLPRVLGPRESVKLPVTVFAMDQQVKQVNIQIITNDLLNLAGEEKKTVSFDRTGEKVINFDLTVAAKSGVGRVKVIATSGKLSAEYEVELEVRHANPPMTTFVAKAVEEGSSWDTVFELPGMEGTNTAVLEVSGIPPVDAGRRLKYLIRYPHGCIEQITSSAFAQLVLNDIMELDDATKSAIDNNIKTGIDKLRAFQLSDGGLSYWPGEQQVNSWGSSYAGHFLIEAEKKGYALPAGIKTAWLRSQRTLARQWQPVETAGFYHQYDLEQAYRLYTLALAGEPETAAMNRLREIKNLTLQAKWRLAAAFALLGQTSVANELIARETTEIQKYKGFYSSYGSRERDWAMILETMVLLNDKTRGAVMARKISDVLSSSSWMSTQTTAYCLLSMSKFAKGITTGRLDFSCTLPDGKTVHGSTEKAITQLSLPLGKSAATGHIHVVNKGKGMLFTRIIMEGIPEAGNETDFNNNLGMHTEYLTPDGRILDISKLTQGTDFIAVVTVSNPGDYDYRDMALSQVFPPGWEINTMRLGDAVIPAGSAAPTYQDIRDDRIHTYFDLMRGEKKTFTVQLNAAYLGRFYLSGTYCEAMYDNSIGAMVKGKWVEIEAPGN